ncbi:MAG: hypothetical protein PX481_28585 [Microcystis sp. M53603_WE2]|uniref:hypothetical protein n=2 Tax=Microcystis TaxID=1125 RepID=UPI000302EEA4|nr:MULTISPECIES: hypothetical protein [unclassified Microcystis]MCZ8027155.1 hypothetical protein [Microcystis sp. LE19-10.1B]MDJ0525217.1 hypothetical protein [Microcystis sp. M53600_WE12]MDJ0542559.1 hypothetical protein [Microcystis sp. M53603_WE2]MDJ0605594.1 hypothetical protein [Microcystis sp. M53602_WE12]
MLRFWPIVFYLERTNQLSLLPDKDLVDLCPPIEPYQVPKSQCYLDSRWLNPRAAEEKAESFREGIWEIGWKNNDDC